MSDDFDAYYTWLAIPPEEQPPDYYRLLGLRPFEENKDAIANAAAQRMTHIRSQATSKNKTVAQEIKLANGWWDAAPQAQEAVGKAAMLSRAGVWYQKAQPQLTSTILQQKVDTRLKQIRPAGGQDASP